MTEGGPAHRQSCRNTSCRSRCSTDAPVYSGGGSELMVSAAVCWMSVSGNVGLMRLANGPANCIRRARTYSCEHSK